MTFNELLLFVGSISGLVAGAMIGHRLSGLGGAVVGGVLGSLFGYLLARFSNQCFRALETHRIRRKSTCELEALIGDQHWQWVDVVLLELKHRGIDTARHADFLLALMGSDHLHERLMGKRAFEVCFPDKRHSLSEYSPFEDARMCREKLSRILARSRTNGLSQ